MILIKKLIFIFFFLNLFASQSHSQESVYYIDLDKILNESKLGKSVLSNLNEMNKKNKNILKQKEEELKNKDNELKSKQSILSEKEFTSEVDKFKIKIKEFNNEKEILIKNFNDKKKIDISNFFKNINPIIQKYMNEKSITILLERKNVFIGKATSEITDDIIKLINEKF